MRWVLTSWLCLGCAPEKGASGADSDQSTHGDSAEQQDSGDLAGAADCDEQVELSWENWGRSFFRTWCAGCHGADAPDRYGAPESLVFDSEAQVFGHRALIRDSVLEAGRMPLGGGLPQAEAEVLDLYLRCGFGD